jgi:hypothetical protein
MSQPDHIVEIPVPDETEGMTTGAVLIPVPTDTVNTATGEVERSTSNFMLLPAPPGTCERCAVAHNPLLFHDQRSLHWQYDFYGRIGRWPTWADAAAHCEPEVVAALADVLDDNGIAHDLRDGE